MIFYVYIYMELSRDINTITNEEQIANERNVTAKDQTGDKTKLKRNGTRTERNATEQNRNGIGTKRERKRKGNGIEWKWNGNRTERNRTNEPTNKQTNKTHIPQPLSRTKVSHCDYLLLQKNMTGHMTRLECGEAPLETMKHTGTNCCGRL